jgi:4-amino-4-deoxy-L-arabinose transferase-like glycosyltransferase
MGRLFSAIFSTLTIVNVYLISKTLIKNKYLVLTSALLAALIPGSIQQAHFTTPESTLTFFLTFSVFLWVWWIKDRRLGILFLSAISLGLATATKNTAVLTYSSSLPIFLCVVIKTSRII